MYKNVEFLLHLTKELQSDKHFEHGGSEALPFHPSTSHLCT